jgi:hypothetical protein
MCKSEDTFCTQPSYWGSVHKPDTPQNEKNKDDMAFTSLPFSLTGLQQDPKPESQETVCPTAAGEAKATAATAISGGRMGFRKLWHCGRGQRVHRSVNNKTDANQI